MSKISKELIESYRKIVLPFVSNQLCKADFEGQGEIDKTEFEQDFNEILDLAISSLNPTGDLISREALKKAIEEVEDNYDGYEPNDLGKFINEVYDLIDNAPTVPLPSEQIAWEQGYEVGLAQGKHNKPQVTVFAENADEKAVSDLKAELQNVIEARPKGKWEMIRPYKYKCDICGCETSEEDGLSNFCPDCGADMRGGAE